MSANCTSMCAYTCIHVRTHPPHGTMPRALLRTNGGSLDDILGLAVLKFPAQCDMYLLRYYSGINVGLYFAHSFLSTFIVYISSYSQGLTQTFLSSGPQDHQLRESGGPTIFLVVLRLKSRHTNSYAYVIKK